MNQSIRRIPALLFLAALAAAVFAMTASAAGSRIVPNRYIVVFKDSVDKPGNLARTQAQQKDGELGFIYRHGLKGYSAELSKDAVQALRNNPRVASVEPDVYGGIASQATPTGISRVFAPTNGALDIDEQDDARIDADIAILDTGIAYLHPDLDVVGRTDCSNGTKEEASCVDGKGSDGHGHGTHVAGTAAAIDNGYGVVGTAPGARLWAVKVLDDSGNGFLSELIAGIDWVTATRTDEDLENDIEVVNMSLRYWSHFSSEAFEQAISTSLEAGVVHVTIAGNEAEEVRYIPGNYPDLITVSALGDFDGKSGNGGKGQDQLAKFSNYGPLVDVAAPGVEILSTVPWEPGYEGGWSGTSMASPHVAGAAAVFASRSQPTSKTDVEAIRNAIVESGNLDWNDSSGDGIKEPLLDLSDEGMFDLPSLPLATTKSATQVNDEGATFNATINPNAFETTYQFEYGTTTSYGTTVPLTAKEIGSGIEDVVVSEKVTGLKAETKYHYRITATNEKGTALGADQSFTTLAALGAESEPVTATESSKATLNGIVSPRGLKTTYQFEYGTTTSYGSKAPVTPASIGAGTSPVEVSETISGLAPETTYHYRLVATDEEDAAYGKDRAFTTLPPNIEFDFQFGKSGSGNGQFAGPSDLAVDSQGNIWVVDSQNDRVQKFNAKGEYLSQFGKHGTGSGQFNTPQGIGIDSQGNVWVADTENDRVQKFNSKGEYLSQFGSGQLNEPSDVAIDLQGNPLVAEYGNGSILKFNSSGKFIRILAEGGPRLTVDPEGNIWFPNADRVVRLDRSGNHLATIAVGELENAVSVAIDPARDVWVLENDRIVQLDSEGEFISEYGEGGAGEGQLYEPAGIATDTEGNVWVANTSGQSVQKWLWMRQTGWRTAGPGYVGLREATLNAVINPEGAATSYHFEYDNGSTSSKSAGSGTKPIAVSSLVTDVEVGGTHKYRVVVSTEFGTAYGDWRQFAFQVPQGEASAPKVGSVWRIKGKTLAELGKSSVKVESAGKFEITIPELEVSFHDCRQTGEGVLKQPDVIELSLTLSGCEIAGLEEVCTVEPFELELAGKGGSLHGQEAWLMQIVTKGAECPWYPEAFVEEDEVGISAEFGMESIGLPVEMQGSVLLSEGQLPVQLLGYSIWEIAQGSGDHGAEFGLG